METWSSDLPGGLCFVRIIFQDGKERVFDNSLDSSCCCIILGSPCLTVLNCKSLFQPKFRITDLPFLQPIPHAVCRPCLLAGRLERWNYFEWLLVSCLISRSQSQIIQAGRGYLHRFTIAVFRKCLVKYVLGLIHNGIFTIRSSLHAEKGFRCKALPIPTTGLASIIFLQVIFGTRHEYRVPSVGPKS